MLRPALPMFRCPVCGEALALPALEGARERGPARCGAGHAFDVARQGYVNLLGGAGRAGLAADTAEMVAARERVQSAGLFAPVAAAVADALADTGLPDGGLLDVGGGTGYYAAAALEAVPGRAGGGLDLSVYAARRAARAHPRLGAAVADVTRALPLGDGVVAAALCVFAPRPAPELLRVLAPGGTLAVVTPGPDHLAPLVEELGLLTVDPRKDERLADRLAAFDHERRARVRREMRLDRDAVAALALMGPSAFHRSPDALAQALAAGPTTRDVTLDVRLDLFRA